MRDFDSFSFTGLTHLYKKKNFKNERIYHGILTPTDWDEYEVPTEYSLFTIDEEDLLLQSSHLKKKFYSLVNKPVEVVAEARRNQWGDKYLRVKKIRQLKDSEYERITQNINSIPTAWMPQYQMMV